MERYFDDDNENENTKQHDLNNAKKAAELLAKSGLNINISSEEEEELIRYIIKEEIEFTE
jgi:hypothetical protein